MLKSNEVQRGFGLITLLAVIVILAALVIVIMPQKHDVETGDATDGGGGVWFSVPSTVLQMLSTKSESEEIADDYGLDYNVDSLSRTIKISLPEKILTVKCQLKSPEGKKNCVVSVVAHKKAKF